MKKKILGFGIIAGAAALVLSVTLIQFAADERSAANEPAPSESQRGRRAVELPGEIDQQKMVDRMRAPQPAPEVENTS